MLVEAEVNTLIFTKSKPGPVGGFLAAALKWVDRGSMFSSRFQIVKLSVTLHSTPEQIHRLGTAKCGHPASLAIPAPSPSPPALPPEPAQPQASGKLTTPPTLSTALHHLP